MDLLVANKIMLNKGKTLDTISQAEALNTFFKIELLMYCSKTRGYLSRISLAIPEPITPWQFT